MERTAPTPAYAAPTANVMVIIAPNRSESLSVQAPRYCESCTDCLEHLADTEANGTLSRAEGGRSGLEVEGLLRADRTFHLSWRTEKRATFRS